jgi:hypothetical protein
VSLFSLLIKLKFFQRTCDNEVKRHFRNAITDLQAKLHQWNEFETLQDKCVTWLRDTDLAVHSIHLKATCEEKKQQSESLKVRRI